MTDITSSAVSRRGLLAGLGVAGVAAFSPFGALGARTANAAGKPSGFSYGELAPVKDQATGLPLLMLPKGFEYISYGWTGDLMSNGQPTPGSHDGMAAFGSEFRKGLGGGLANGNQGSGNDDRIVSIVRNHERNGYSGAFTNPSYDAEATGGTTTLTFDSASGKWLDTVPSLGGNGSDLPAVGQCRLAENPWIHFINHQRGYHKTTYSRSELRQEVRVVPFVTQPGAPGGHPCDGRGRRRHPRHLRAGRGHPGLMLAVRR